MDNNNWRPAPGGGGGGGGGEPTMDAGDWRSQLQPDSRQRIVNKIMDTLKRHLPFSGQEGLQELKKIAVRFEEKIYTSATSQPDYLRKISLKMLTMETKSQNTMANSLPSNSGTSSKNPPDTGSLGNQGQSLPNPMVGNQAHARQQLLSQNIQNNMAATAVQGSANLASALPTIGGLPPTTMPNVVGQNSNLQNIQNVSGISQNSVGNSMGQGVSPNIFANTQRQMPGRQQVVPQQQQSQNPQQQFVYQQQQQLQQQLMKQKYQQGSIPNTQIQSHLQQQQAQHQQNQMLSQSSQLQPSQQSVMQHSVMQPAPVSGLQQNQQSSVQQSTQTMLQQNSQAVLRQQQQQPSIIHQQQTPMQQQPSMLSSQQQQPSMLPSQQQQQQQLMGQQPNSTILQQNQIVGQQNSIPDLQQQQQRLLSQQNSLTNLQQQQQQQLMGQQNNIPNMHQQQQQLGAQSNMGALQQRQQQQQQQLLVNQSGNSSMQTTQHSVHMLQQSKISLQQQNHQSVPTLLPTQGQQSEPQPSQQQLLSQLQSQPGQLQQQGLQQPNPLQRDMQQRLQTSGPLLQSQNMIDQQKQLLQPQRPIPEASSTSLDSTAQTGNANNADWQEEIYQKIKVMKEAYLPELNEMCQKIAGKLQQHDSLPQQPKNEQFEKLKLFKSMLERILQFLQVPKSGIQPNFKEKLGAYEKQIVNFLNSNRPRKPGPSLQQGQQIPPPHIQSMQQSQQSQSQITQVHPMQENQMNPQLQSMNLQGSSVATLQQNNVATLQHNSLSSLSGVPTTSQRMISTLQPGSTIDSGQGIALNALQQVAVSSLQQNPVNAQQQANINSLSSYSGMNVLQPNLTPRQSNSNMLQHQHLKQQEQQMLQTQLKQQFQQRHMQQQMMQKQQLLLLLLQQQQQQQQLHQQNKQQQNAQLQPHQMPQLHQMNDANDLKMRQQMGVETGVFQQHHSAEQHSGCHHQQLKSGAQLPIPSPQLLQAASPHMPQHPSPQIDQQNLLTSLTKAGTPLQSTSSPFIVPSPSTRMAPSPMPVESEKVNSAISALSNTGNIGHQLTAGAITPGQSLAIGTPGISASPLLAEFTSPDGKHGNASAVVSGKSSVTEQPLERLLKVVKSMSPAKLSASVSDIDSVVSMMDGIAGSAPGNGSRTAVGVFFSVFLWAMILFLCMHLFYAILFIYV